MPENKRSPLVRIPAHLVQEAESVADRLGWQRHEVMAKALEIGFEELDGAAQRLSHPVMQWILRAVVCPDNEDFEALMDRLRDARNEQQRLEFAS